MTSGYGALRITGLHAVSAAQMLSFVREPFERAMARGELDPALSVEILAELVVSPFLARVAVMRAPVDENLGKSVAAVMRAIGRPGTDRDGLRGGQGVAPALYFGCRRALTSVAGGHRRRDG